MPYSRYDTSGVTPTGSGTGSHSASATPVSIPVGFNTELFDANGIKIESPTTMPSYSRISNIPPFGYGSFGELVEMDWVSKYNLYFIIRNPISSIDDVNKAIDERLMKIRGNVIYLINTYRLKTEEINQDATYLAAFNSLGSLLPGGKLFATSFNFIGSSFTGQNANKEMLVLVKNCITTYESEVKGLVALHTLKKDLLTQKKDLQSDTNNLPSSKVTDFLKAIKPTTWALLALLFLIILFFYFKYRK